MQKDITFHYTNPEMVKYLLDIANINQNASVLDCGSGKNKVWYNLLPNKEKYECEIEDGIAFLGNINFFNSLTPKRIILMQEKGFYLQRIEVVADKRWFGRYYFLIWTKEKNNFLNANTKSF